MQFKFTIQQASSPAQIKKFGEMLANLFRTSKEGYNMYKAFYNSNF